MNKKILIIGFVWPEPKSSAAGNRMLQLIELFNEDGWQITFASAASESEFMDPLDFYKIIKKEIQLNSTSFDSFIAELQPDVVVFDRFMTEEQFGWRVGKYAPNALRILDTEDLRCLRLARQKAVQENREFHIEELLKEETAKREISSIYRCDLSLIVSEFEFEVLVSTFHINSALLFYLPIFGQASPSTADFNQRKDFVFIGNFLHDPNKDAVYFLKQKIWPIIHAKLAQASLNIYGAYAPQAVLQLNDKKLKFLVHGRADDSKKVIENARVMLAPLRFGAGIKGKLLEAMQFGTPSITTTVGAEAMHGDLNWNGSIVNSAVEIAEHAIALYNDESAWVEAQKFGARILENRFSAKNYVPFFLDYIHNLGQSLAEHRTQNFIGAMLMHHSMKSTEYMSKWIEAKNK